MKAFPSASETDGSSSPASESPSRLKFWILAAIIITALLWCASLPLPVWDTRSDHTGEWDAPPGLLPALLGWLGIFALCPAWFANVLLIAVLIAPFKWPRAAFPLAVVAFVLACTAYMMPGIYGDADEAVIVGRRIGFYLWLGSFLAIALAYAIPAPGSKPWMVLRLAVVALMVFSIFGWERMYPVGLSPLEVSLKDPKDLAPLAAALARNPSQSEKDAALWWAMRQEIAAGPKPPSQKIVMLLAAGADPNKPDKYEGTLLRYALQGHCSAALLELLVKAGADVNARDNQGKTVLDIANEWWFGHEYTNILIQAGAQTSGK